MSKEEQPSRRSIQTNNSHITNNNNSKINNTSKISNSKINNTSKMNTSKNQTNPTNPTNPNVPKTKIAAEENSKKEENENSLNMNTVLNIFSYEDKYSCYDSKMINSPIINITNYQKALNSQLKASDPRKSKLRVLDYAIIKESFHQCSSFPSKIRKYVWQYLFSLPHSRELYKMYSNRGIHPFFKFSNDMYPLENQDEAKNLQIVCSLLSHYSPAVGNVFFLADMVYPFIKLFPGENILIFETVIAVINSIGNFWFQYYPGSPIYHLKLTEKIVKNETPAVIDKLYEIYKKTNISQNQPVELIWRLIRTLFSESLIKEQWAQVMDFLICYNYKPEMILYFAASYLIYLEGLITKCEDITELKKILYDIIPGMKMSKIFKRALVLYDKYNRYQLFKYRPYIPSQFDKYISVNYAFPRDAVQNADHLSKEMFKIAKDYDNKDSQLNNVEKKFKKLLENEEKMQRHFKCEINKEIEKSLIIKHELDNALYSKAKYTTEIYQRKIDKLSGLNKTIGNTINIIDDLNQAQMDRINQEMQYRKEYENNVILHEKDYQMIHNMDNEANNAMNKLIELRKEKQKDLLVNDITDYQNEGENIKYGIYTNNQGFSSLGDNQIYTNNNKNNDIRNIKNVFDNLDRVNNEYDENDHYNLKENNNLVRSIGVDHENLKFQNEVLEKYRNDSEPKGYDQLKKID